MISALIAAGKNLYDYILNVKISVDKLLQNEIVDKVRKYLTYISSFVWLRQL